MYTKAIETGGVAVVTGAASGVGLAAAARFGEAGLHVVLADLAGETLESAVQIVRAQAQPGQTIKGVPCDVTDTASVTALADTAFDLGPIAVLMNNAGISMSSSTTTHADAWRAMFEVNLFGVLNGVQAFVPRMIEAGHPGVVINTGSKQGITSPPGNPGYNATKAAVKVLSEQLAHELREAGAPISAHLFVPGFTYTGMIARFMPEKPAAAWTSEETVDYLISRMSDGDFYILCPDNDVTEDLDRKRVAWSAGDILENRPALSRWHPDWAETYKDHEQS